jgi:hypothetical protein
VSHTLEYSQDAYYKGGVLVASAYDAAGFLNASRNARPLPDLKGRAFGEYSIGNHNVLLYANHITSYDDERYAGVSVDAQTTFDFHYQLGLSARCSAVNVFVLNVSDEEPPAARLDLSYDGYTHNAFGRMFKVGLEYSFVNN